MLLLLSIYVLNFTYDIENFPIHMIESMYKSVAFKNIPIQFYQVEGAWNEDGKGPSIWDVFTADPNSGNVINGENGQVACDSYHKYKEDVQLLKNMSANSYRFSIAWTRILPKGTGEINQLGIDYYNNLINELIANEITPAVTLYHWDLPQALQEQGGWLNPESAYWFENYARIGTSTI